MVLRKPPSPKSSIGERDRIQAEECAKLVSLPVQHAHAAGIDVGDSTHWVCVDATPDGSDTVREFPAYTPGPAPTISLSPQGLRARSRRSSRSRGVCR